MKLEIIPTTENPTTTGIQRSTFWLRQ